MKFRKKPVVIEAIQWTGFNCDDVIIFMPIEVCAQPMIYGDEVRIKTLEGVMTASPGDWIIKGVKGEFYPCKPDIFEATYERVEE